MRARVLVVDDDRAMCSLVEAGLARYSFEVTWKTRADEAFEILNASDFDAVVTDLNMRGMSGLEPCERIVANRPDIPVIVITAFGSLDTAVVAIRAGAYDSLTKPFEKQALRIALERGVQHRKLRDEVRRLRQAVTDGRRLGELLGNSLPMRQVFGLLERISDQDVSVLITGETGTGKERVAKTLHRRGARVGTARSWPSIARRCRRRSSRASSSVTRAARLHRCAGGTDRALRPGERRNAVPRRDRGAASGPSAQASPRAPGEARRARR